VLRSLIKLGSQIAKLERGGFLEMPIYEYECTQCGKVEEVLQNFSESPLTTCVVCSGRLNKIISQSAFHLKGSGWYVTDYAGKSANEKDNTSSNTKTSTKSETGKNEKSTDKTPPS
jgi:putative FmdB family regulatory protein